jgi:hypothetical protein
MVPSDCPLPPPNPVPLVRGRVNRYPQGGQQALLDPPICVSPKNCILSAIERKLTLINNKLSPQTR